MDPKNSCGPSPGGFGPINSLPHPPTPQPPNPLPSPPPAPRHRRFLSAPEPSPPLLAVSAAGSLEPGLHSFGSSGGCGCGEMSHGGGGGRNFGGVGAKAIFKNLALPAWKRKADLKKDLSRRAWSYSLDRNGLLFMKSGRTCLLVGFEGKPKGHQPILGVPPKKRLTQPILGVPPKKIYSPKWFTTSEPFWSRPYAGNATCATCEARAAMASAASSIIRTASAWAKYLIGISISSWGSSFAGFLWVAADAPPKSFTFRGFSGNLLDFPKS